MAKKKTKKRRARRQVMVDRGTEVASTELSIHPDATLGPDASLEPPSSGHLVAQDSTTAPEIGKESDTDETYPATQWTLIEKVLRSPGLFRLVLSIIFIGFIGWIIIQDNGAGNLTNWKSMWWTIQKCGLLLVLFVAILLVIEFHQKIFR